MTKNKARATSMSSIVTELSNADSLQTTIHFKGSTLRLNCDPLKLVQFLFIDLKSMLKDYVPAGELHKVSCGILSIPPPFR